MQHAMAGTRMPIWGDGSIERDFLHVSDVADAFLASLTHDGPSSVINIGSGQARTVNEVLDATRRHTSRVLDVGYQPNRPIDVHRNVLSIQRAQAELEWAPKIDFDEGLARTARWWLNQPEV
jgi:UDP-glucose 4-epimerase